MIKMWHKKGFTFLAPQEEVKKRLSEGHALLPDQEITIAKADGSGVENVSGEYFARNLNLTPLTQLDVTKRKSIEESPDISTGAAALGSSFAEGATAGASNMLLRGIGEATDSELENFAKLTQDKHPILSGVGKVGGALYTFARAGMKLNPAFTAAGQGMVKGVAHIFGKSVPKNWIAKSAAYVGSLAAEGLSLFTGYDLVQRATSEEGLSIEEVPEVMANNLKLNVLVGGGVKVIGKSLSAGARGIGKLANKALPKTKNAPVEGLNKRETVEMANTLKNFGFEKQAVQKFKDNPKEVFNHMEKIKKEAMKRQYIKNSDDVSDIALEKETRRIVDEAKQNIVNVRKTLGKSSDEQMNALAGLPKGTQPKTLMSKQEVLSGAYKIIKDHKGISNPQREQLINQMDSLLGQPKLVQNVKGKLNVTPSDYVSYKGIEDLRGSLGDLYKESISQVSGVTSKQRLINRLYGYANGLENNIAKRTLSKGNYDKFIKSKKDYEINLPLNSHFQNQINARLYGRSSLNQQQKTVFDSQQLLYIYIGGFYSGGASPLFASAGGALAFQTTKELSNALKIYAGKYPFRQSFSQKAAQSITGGVEALSKRIRQSVNSKNQFLNKASTWGTAAYWGEKYRQQGEELNRKPMDMKKPMKESLKQMKEKMGAPTGASTEELIEIIHQASGDIDSFLEAVENPVNAIRAEGFDDIGDEALKTSMLMKEFITQIAPKPTYKNGMDFESPEYSDKQIKEFEEDMVPFIKPESTLQSMLEGAYNPKHLKIVKTFYPQFYNKFVSNLIGSVHQMKRPLRNDEKMRLYRLTGFSPDNSVSPLHLSLSSQLMARDNQIKMEAQDRLNKKIDIKSKMKAMRTQTERGEQWG